MSLEVRDGMVPVIVGDQSDRTHCPICGMAIRLERQTYYNTEHYVARMDSTDMASVLVHQDEKTAKKLKKERKGKKTVAFVGLAPTSCSLAPFDDPDVEIWCLNEAHAFPSWLTRWDRWFQIHAPKSWKRDIAKRNVRGHYNWLKQEHYVKDHDIVATEPAWKAMMDHRKVPFWKKWFEKDEYEHFIEQKDKRMKPIYMQYWNPNIPNSVSYPILDVSKIVFENFRRGDKKVKYFTSTFAYMAGIAVLEDFDRVEVYGFEFADDIEYVKQKACSEFWTGYMMGAGIDVYTPPNNQMLYSTLYGGQ